ncbi:probable ubiquitin thiolesterase L3 [Cephalotrichum gorgonifer]|uniref:Ubiquitin carboxyl-terminal hydrolase n=1 Tax=Cephalotrichum gorgonifer TaxID=2041049 RepID=A0AAE8SQX5_9PEZI|nr:probable ubiquitin thiolesterase L3 [Cephalotrichum gorgonifer]
MSTTPGVSYDKDGRKTLIPLENNPDVFADLARNLGVAPSLGFHDVFSIDEPELLAMVPRPVHSLLVIVPAPVYYRVREKQHGYEEITYEGAGADEPVTWFKQTIRHTCGLIALLHSISNGPAREFVVPGSELDKLLAEALPLKPRERAELLYNSEFLEKAHMAAAVKGDTVAPAGEEPNGYHFICFVKGKDGHLWELEGASDGPIDRGLLADDEDVLSEKALDAGIRRFTRVAEGNLEFSVVALADSD